MLLFRLMFEPLLLSLCGFQNDKHHETRGTGHVAALQHSCQKCRSAAPRHSILSRYATFWQYGPLSYIFRFVPALKYVVNALITQSLRFESFCATLVLSLVKFNFIYEHERFQKRWVHPLSLVCGIGLRPGTPTLQFRLLIELLYYAFCVFTFFIVHFRNDTYLGKVFLRKWSQSTFGLMGVVQTPVATDECYTSPTLTIGIIKCL